MNLYRIHLKNFSDSETTHVVSEDITGAVDKIDERIQNDPRRRWKIKEVRCIELVDENIVV